MVTDGGRGIGGAISDALAAHGAAVVVCGRNTVTLHQAKHAITKRAGQAASMHADVSNETDVIRLRDHLTAPFGVLDILVNNAGIRGIANAYGFVEIELTAGMVARPYTAPRLLARIPMGRFGRTDEGWPRFTGRGRRSK